MKKLQIILLFTWYSPDFDIFYFICAIFDFPGKINPSLAVLERRTFIFYSGIDEISLAARLPFQSLLRTGFHAHGLQPTAHTINASIAFLNCMVCAEKNRVKGTGFRAFSAANAWCIVVEHDACFRIADDAARWTNGSAARCHAVKTAL